MQAASENDLAAPGQALRHQYSFCGGGRAIIHGGIGDLHAGQVDDLGLELKQHLQGTLRYFRLVGRVGGQPFRALDEMIHRCGHMVTIGSGTNKKGSVGGCAILARQRPHMGFHRKFRVVRRQRERSFQL